MAIASNDVTINQGFKSFIPNKGYSTSFVYYSIKNSLKLIEKNASGSTFKEIAGTVLKSLSILLPLKFMINDFSKKVAAIFESQKSAEKQNQQLTQLRDWLLPMVMNGQVKVGGVEQE